MDGMGWGVVILREGSLGMDKIGADEGVDSGGCWYDL